MIALPLLLLVPSLASPSQTAADAALSWPREVVRDTYTIVVHQPQIAAWEDLRVLRLEMAVVVTLGEEPTESYGVLRMSSESTVDVTGRVVRLKALEVDELIFDGVEGRRANRLQAAVLTNLPTQTWEISLDRILAGMADIDVDLPEIEVDLTPPDIYYLDRPAILVQFLGEPEFEEVAGTGLEAATNTNWDLFRDRNGTLYLLDGDGWLTAPGLDAEVWTVAHALPHGMTTLPDEGFEDVRERVPGTPADSAPVIFISNVPAELIVTDGKPRRKMVPNVALMWIDNTDSDLFFFDGRYYVLLAGRWFRAPDLAGPWASAVGSLPVEFRSLPFDHPRAEVLASVPGSADAKAAAIQASLPHTGTVERSATIVVTYDGEPRFEEIEGTAVSACVNTAFEVLRCDEGFFCCHRGIWFESDAPRGTWTVCVDVPDAIYDIPSTSPYYDVTYVEVESYDGEEVELACYPGYYGTYVYGGCPYYGSAWWLLRRRAHIRWRRYPAHSYAYGCGVRFSFRGGAYVRFGRRYGPYGGCGTIRSHNESTGAWGRQTYRYSGAFGARAASSYGARDVEAAGRVAGGSPYSGAEALRGSGGVVAARAGVRTSEQKSAAAAARNRSDRPRLQPSKSAGRDLYAGRGGEVLERGADGSWSRHSSSGWRPVLRDEKGNYRDAPQRTAKSAERPAPADRRPGAPAARDRAGAGEERAPSTRGQRRDSTRRDGASSATRRSTNIILRLELEHRSRLRGHQRARSGRTIRSSGARRGVVVRGGVRR